MRIPERAKDRLRRIVREWDMQEESELRDAEAAAGYPIGQTLKTNNERRQ